MNTLKASLFSALMISAVSSTTLAKQATKIEFYQCATTWNYNIDGRTIRQETIPTMLHLDQMLGNRAADEIIYDRGPQYLVRNVLTIENPAIHSRTIRGRDQNLLQLRLQMTLLSNHSPVETKVVRLLINKASPPKTIELAADLNEIRTHSNLNTWPIEVFEQNHQVRMNLNCRAQLN